MTFHAIIVAGGSGSRSGGKKQWMPLGGKPVLDWSVTAFAEAGQIVIVVPPEDVARAEQAYGARVQVVAGGGQRADSVVNGLKALTAADEDLVMIHDAARPLLKASHIGKLLAALEQNRAAILALPVTDTLKKSADGLIIDTPPREDLWRAQTPQAFRYGDILRAYAAWPTGQTATDEAMVAAHSGIVVALVEGDIALHKLTYGEDFALLEALLHASKPLKQIRIGQGFDAHRWGEGESVWLCGVEIAHSQTLIGHSDADAGLHALTDALLGAAALGDIGDHFPPSDPQWKGASSDLFLRYAAQLIRQKGGAIINIDVTLICEQPKIKPHREAMRARLAAILGLEIQQVSVKATTTEGMGFTGRGEGLAAQAVCMIEI
ncbi:bifunctional 2-C-methyl-D-erythritol 4-phosphate cytidylyltransferase/2-C-methyl-D-erythritol 2,4-cyclodiphosphate synthase [Asticcacaulis sp. EMRT-3]|uniref:bifunctional 2-C-methyl-D-erythritol 4-phosphate cytidylyltransferase/2-C-methyl-D-erythritol 2,4-cyclodiphosphate synthase n=1 Tax=Asticcacaulis sp. EMRT-3 TaxID=3040349 RepID=UPI0024AED6E6|nr:bifunctional 2-C-methyl-D-erythritol 4-phosphate cytidylyltransferase/2-C-methyl-D-erythritol 2,4-cyclodiphosphate synthase [Asticcacaulis sp. EMRT-3]MDI7774516.1 bifunctional 2-C-methyl-D-erythritol 4-phosphate cytidylyltransferase/2-C-methyl-D-erythritol 2,4-cyclodiphosphate synthase [Asticcacaulis sp. EMRT-3]